MDKKSVKFRFLIILCFVLIFSFFAFLKLFNLQVVLGEDFRKISKKNYKTNIKIKPLRGEIVDRYGRVLSSNTINYNIVLNKSSLKEEEEEKLILNLIKVLDEFSQNFVDLLPITKSYPFEFESGKEYEVAALKQKLGVNSYATAENCMNILIEKFSIKNYQIDEARLIAGVKYSMIVKDFSLNNGYVFAENISKELAMIFEEKNYIFQGVEIVETPIRKYLSEDLIPHIIGNVGPIYQEEYEKLKEEGYSIDSKIGKSGIEKSMENYLKGEEGVLSIEQDENGNILEVKTLKEAINGDTVVLTVDKEFQKKVQIILENHIKYLNNAREKGKDAFAGSIEVLDVKTGEVLASATYPTYDINNYNIKYDELMSDKNMPLFNRSLNGLYRPGSTYKTVVALAGLAEGIIDENSKFYCGGIYNFFGTSKGSYRPTCTGFHGNINVVNSLKYSCNIFFYEVGRILGIDKINNYASGFGLAQNLEYNISNRLGQLASPTTKDNWVVGDVVQAAIGQSETYVTPLQMAVQAMTFANKGIRYRPYIVKYSNRYDYSKKTFEQKPEVVSDMGVQKELFDIVEKGMVAASGRVSGKYNLNSLPFKVALKTGTPQITKNQFNSTVIAYAPVENPEIAISVVVEKGEYASYIIKQVIDEYYKLRYTNNDEYKSNEEYLLE